LNDLPQIVPAAAMLLAAVWYAWHVSTMHDLQLSSTAACG